MMASRVPAGSARACLTSIAPSGGSVTLTVRPERLRLGTPPADANVWPATLERIVYLGARLELRLRLADGTPAMAEAANDGRFAGREGEAVTAWFHPDDAWIILESPS